MSGRSAFWLLYFSSFLFLFTVIIITAFVSMQLCGFGQNSRLVFIHLPSLFLHFGFRVAPILRSGTLVFAKEWFFFRRVGFCFKILHLVLLF